MSQEQFWVLLSKKLSGEASEEELEALALMLEQHPEWQFAAQNMETIWGQKSTADTSQSEDAFLLHLHRMQDRQVKTDTDHSIISSTEKSGIIGRKWLRVAAMLALLVTTASIGILYLSRSAKSNETENIPQVYEIASRNGSKTSVNLPDGTVVLLNAGSKLTYNKDFGKGTRTVTLAGEGFFDVAENKSLPFIIHTSNIRIKVLGTAFNVKAYPEDKQTETSLIRGSIEVTINNRPNDKIILAPSEKLLVENAIPADHGHTATSASNKNNETGGNTLAPLIAINKLSFHPADSSVAETQWMRNRLVFRNETFGDLAVRLGRWYDVQITIDDQALARERLTGILETETVGQALDALKESTTFHYERKGNVIIVHK